jgi:RNA polymerase sigma-70 factor (ECF subfamily)
MSTSISATVDLDSWYRSYASRLRYAARRIVGNAEDAEDATQEAFLAAYRGRETYDGRDPYPWLYRIATRKALTIISSRRPVVQLADGRIPAVPSAEEEALAAWRARLVRELIAGEPDVALHLIGGLHLREIGERRGMPLATAATRVRRGKHRLRSRLKATLTDLPESKPA